MPKAAKPLAPRALLEELLRRQERLIHFHSQALQSLNTKPRG